MLAIVNHDNNLFLISLENILKSHHKKATNKKSYLWNNGNGFLSVESLLLIRLAEWLNPKLNYNIEVNKEKYVIKDLPIRCLKEWEGSKLVGGYFDFVGSYLTFYD